MDRPAFGVAVRALAGQRLVWLGLLALVLGLTASLWPGRPEQLTGRLVGVGLVGAAASHALGLRRNWRSRWIHGLATVVVPGVAGVLLAVEPDVGLPTMARAIGGAVAVWGASRIVRSLGQERGQRSWWLAGGLGWTGLGALLAGFPRQLLGLAVISAMVVVLGVAAIAAAAAIRGEAVAGESGGVLLRRFLLQQPSAHRTREQLVDRLYHEGEDAVGQFVRYAALMTLASALATFGVINDSTAIVVGAMLVAPLMTPLLGASLAVAIGWPRRLAWSGLSVLAGVLIAIGTGILLGGLLPVVVDVESNGQVASRISPTLLDLAVAAAAGIAGAYATSRTDVADSLPGVAVAIALVPPLVVTGIMWQDGEMAAGNGSLLLFATNALAILVLGGITFVVTGTAPLARVAETQHRMRSAVGAIVVLAVVVVGGLALNGAEITQTGFERSAANQAVVDWIADDPSLLVESVVVEQDQVVVVVTGPPTDLEPASLARDLATRLGRSIELDLRHQLQDHTVVDSG